MSTSEWMLRRDRERLMSHLIRWRDSTDAEIIPVSRAEIERLIGPKEPERNWSTPVTNCIFCAAGHPNEIYEGRKIHDGGRGESPCPTYG